MLIFLVLAACTPDRDDSGRSDEDQDGFDAAADCDDHDAAVNPDAPSDPCDEVDNDCDGAIDEDPDQVWYPDVDSDGFGAASAEPLASCGSPGGTVPNHADCDDGDPTAFPGNDESCDGVDNNCDGAVDEPHPSMDTYHIDADLDGAGDPDLTAPGCPGTTGLVTNSFDCDDADPANPVFVAISGATSGDGTLNSPLASIQAALVRTTSRCISVGPGDYFENLVWPERDVKIQSQRGRDNTTIYAGSKGPAVTFGGGQTPVSVLEGFTLVGGGGAQVETVGEFFDGYTYYTRYSATYYGGGIFISNAGPTLRDLRVTGAHLPDYSSTYDEIGLTVIDQSSVGGGLFVSYGTPVLEGVVIDDTFAYQGGAIFIDAGSTVEATHLKVVGNNAGFGIIAVAYASFSATNLLMNANRAPASGWDGLVSSASAISLTNAVLVDSTVALANWSNSQMTMRNSIVYGNLYGFYSADVAYSFIDFSYNNISGNSGGNYVGYDDLTGAYGNISVAPQFTELVIDGDATNDDFSLRSVSLCRDAGDPADIYQDVDGTRNDMGVFGGPGGVW